MENWKDIPGYEGAYQVSDLGRVRSLDRRVRLVAHGIETTRLSRGQILRPGPTKSGHLTVALGRGNSKGVHTLVLRAFVGEPPGGQEGLHLNHTPSDNRLCNLEWGTRAKNVSMDYEVGTRKAKRGESSTGALLTEGQVIEIRSLRGLVFQRVIAERYGVSRQCIAHIMLRLNWAHI